MYHFELIFLPIYGRFLFANTDFRLMVLQCLSRERWWSRGEAGWD